MRKFLLTLPLVFACHRVASPAPSSEASDTSFVCPATYAAFAQLPAEEPLRGAPSKRLVQCSYAETNCVILQPCGGAASVEVVRRRCGSHPMSNACPATEPRPEAPCGLPADQSCFFGVGCGFTEYTCVAGFWRFEMLGGGHPP